MAMRNVVLKLAGVNAGCKRSGSERPVSRRVAGPSNLAAASSGVESNDLGSGHILKPSVEKLNSDLIKEPISTIEEAQRFNVIFQTIHSNLFKNNKLFDVLDIASLDKKELVVAKLRQVYLNEVKANQSLNEKDKLSCFFKSVSLLQELESIFADKNQLQIFIKHQQAKMYYEIGVVLLRSKESVDYFSDIKQIKDILEALTEGEGDKNLCLATQLFQKAYGCYSEENLDSNYGRLTSLDPYHPQLRKAAILTNLKVCEDEGIESIENIEGKLTQLKQTGNESSYAKEPTTKKILKQIEKALSAVDCDEACDNQGEMSSTRPSKRKASRDVANSKLKRQKFTSQSLEVTSQELLDKYNQICAKAIDNDSEVHWLKQISPLQRFSEFLWPRQQSNMKDIFDVFKDDGFGVEKLPHIMVTKPTGSGKSALILEQARHCIENHQPVILVVPSIDLVKQFKDTFDQFVKSKHKDLGVLEGQYATFLPTENIKQIGPITIMTQSSFSKQIKKQIDGKQDVLPNFKLENFKKSMVLMDEAHHGEGKKMRELFLGNEAFKSIPVMGFSASTGDMENEYKQINKLFPFQPVNETLGELIECGELSPIQFEEIDFSMYKQAKELLSRIKEKTDDQALQEINETLTSQLSFSLTACAQFYQRMQTPTSQKGLVFATGISHAQHIATMLTKLTGQQVYAYHSKLSSDERQRILSDFKKEESKGAILVAVDALDEGFDCPAVNRVLDFGYYKHRTRRLFQRLGRALRLRNPSSDTLYMSVKLFKYKEPDSNEGQILPRKFLFANQGSVGNCQQNFKTELFKADNMPGDDFGLGSGSVIEPAYAKVKQSQDTKARPLGDRPVDVIDIEDDQEVVGSGSAATGGQEAGHSSLEGGPNFDGMSNMALSPGCGDAPDGDVVDISMDELEELLAVK